MLMCSLCQIITVLPATSVDCERGFSNLNRIKTDLRSKLQTLHLESLMRISSTPMDAVTLHQDHSDVLIARWRTKRDRRMGEKRDGLLDDHTYS
jgi:hAT family C-terminal dimerisation region